MSTRLSTGSFGSAPMGRPRKTLQPLGQQAFPAPCEHAFFKEFTTVSPSPPPHAAVVVRNFDQGHNPTRIPLK